MRKPSGPCRTASLLLAVAVCGAAGCTSTPRAARQGPDSTLRPSTGATTPGSRHQYDARSFANSPLPLDAYRETPADGAAISRGATRVTNACRQRFGFAPSVQPYLALHALDQFARRYSSVRDLATARRYGYHDPTAESPESSAAAPSPRPPLSVAENLVTYGTPDGSVNPTARPTTLVAGKAIPEGGCSQEGFRAVGAGSFGPSGSPETYGDELQDEAYSRFLTDPRELAVQAQWRGCMIARGYHVHTPLDVPYDAKAPAPSASEITQAVADVTCANQVKLFDVSLAVETDYQNRQIQQHLEQLVRVRKLIDDEVRRAAQLTKAP